MMGAACTAAVLARRWWRRIHSASGRQVVTGRSQAHMIGSVRTVRVDGAGSVMRQPAALMGG